MLRRLPGGSLSNAGIASLKEPLGKRACGLRGVRDCATPAETFIAVRSQGAGTGAKGQGWGNSRTCFGKAKNLELDWFLVGGTSADVGSASEQNAGFVDCGLRDVVTLHPHCCRTWSKSEIVPGRRRPSSLDVTCLQRPRDEPRLGPSHRRELRCCPFTPLVEDVPGSFRSHVL